LQYNCKRWITRFAGRWRTQLAALSGVKCRTRRALDFRTHIAALGLSQRLVCLRVGMKLNTLYKSVVEYTDIKLCTRRTHSYIRPHKTLTNQFMRCVLSFRTLAITAEHYTFCWPLFFCSMSPKRHAFVSFYSDSNGCVHLQCRSKMIRPI